MKDFTKAGWKTAPIGEVAQIRPNKKEAKSALTNEDEVSFVPMDCLKVDQVALAEHEARTLGEVYGGYTYFRDGDVLLAKITPCFENGKLGIANDLTNGVGFGSSEFFVLRPSEELLAGYLYHFLNRQSFRDWAKGQMTGAVGHKRVPKELVEALEIPLPPLKEQQRIVAVLDEAFEGLARARAHAEANLQNAQELFECELNAAFESLSEQHGVKALGGMTDFRNGFAFKSARFKPSGKPVVRISNIQDGEIDEAKMVFTDPDDYSEDLTRYEVQPDDLLIAMSGATTGKVGFNTTGKVLLQNQRVGRFRPTEKLDLRFLYYFLSTKVAEHLSISAGAAQPNLSTKQINEIKIPAPPLDVQVDFVRKIELLEGSVSTVSNNYADSLQDLDDLRQSLLQNAFAGELT